MGTLVENKQNWGTGDPTIDGSLSCVLGVGGNVDIRVLSGEKGLTHEGAQLKFVSTFRCSCPASSSLGRPKLRPFRPTESPFNEFEKTC